MQSTCDAVVPAVYFAPFDTFNGSDLPASRKSSALLLPPDQALAAVAKAATCVQSCEDSKTQLDADVTYLLLASDAGNAPAAAGSASCSLNVSFVSFTDNAPGEWLLV